MKRLIQYFTLLLACFLMACQNDDSVVFSYSPSEPRAGEKISFANLTDEGEEWAWDFGDGGTSTVKSPNKVYREPGTYTVILKVDDKNYRTCTKTITVLDTVPTLRCSVDVIPYFTEVTFSVECYNPNDEEITCKWKLTKFAVITSEDTTSTSLSVYFTTLPGGPMPVYVDVTMGEKEFSLWGNFDMKDRPATGLIIGTLDHLSRQRLYPEGNDEPYHFLSSGAEDLKQLTIYGNNVYSLNSGINYSHINQHNINKDLDYNEAFHTLRGYTTCISVVDNYFYYYNKKVDFPEEQCGLIRYNFNTNTNTVVASPATVEGFPEQVNAIAVFTSIFYLAQEKGVYRFTEQNGQIQPLETILADYAITHLGIDEMARKLYFIADGALYVSHIDGTMPVRIAEKANALCVDNSLSRIYYAASEGVVYLPLVQSQNNTTTAEPVFVNNTPNVVALTVDNTAR